MNKLRDVAREKKAEDSRPSEIKTEEVINTREHFAALPAQRQLEIALADGHDNVPAYIAENFPENDVDLNKLREQVRKLDEEKK